MSNEPIVTKLLSGYKYMWYAGDEWVLTAQITKIYEHKRGVIDGEIEITHHDKDIPILSGIRINLTSQSARTTIAKRLKANPTVEEFDWPKMIDEICAATVKLQREGEPIKELWTSEDIPPLEYLIDPVLMKDIPTVMFGDKGVAKSTLSLLFYVILMLPWYDNPLGLKAPSRSIKTIILDWEVPGYIAQWNAKKVQEGMGLPAFPLYHRRCNYPLADDIEGIRNMIVDLKAEVIIVDSLARAAGGDLSKDTENANRFFAALDNLQVTSLIIAQTSKNQDEKKKSIYGNALYTYYARSIFELCKSQEINEDTMSIALFHRFSNLTRLQKPMGFKLSFNGVGTKIERQELSAQEFKGKLTGQQVILAELKRGSKTVIELADSLEWEEKSVRPLLSKMKGRKLIVNVGPNEWGLISTNE
ncbi:MAG: hypothetical protein CMI54_02825 [Parcubacteria group bacterium]|nr:hypothetical protein [Parcubacteria group bacterium]|tara:strand:+ start:5815 stop:7065 length:1251 start_codon:yes stop_codon:yes gene_type:complete